MGYIKHEALVIVAWGYKHPGSFRISAFRDDMPEEYRQYLVGPFDTINGYETWCFLPDGSKEGWDTSNEVQEWRKKLAALCDEIGVTGWSYSYFGGDDEIARHVTNDDGAEAI